MKLSRNSGLIARRRTRDGTLSKTLKCRKTIRPWIVRIEDLPIEKPSNPNGLLFAEKTNGARKKVLNPKPNEAIKRSSVGLSMIGRRNKP